MSGISFIGSYSGIDGSTIEQLMAAERAPLNQLNSKKTNITGQQNAWKDVNTRLNSLFDKLKALQEPASFNTMKPVSSNKDVLTASASSDAVAGTYTINVEKLATRANLIGGQVKEEEITAGSFNIRNQGEEVEITIEAGDSLKDIVKSINDNEISVGATIIDGKLVLTSEKEGEGYIQLYGNGDGVLDNLGLDRDSRINRSGQNALLNINGIDISSKSNTVSDTVLGLTLNLHEEGKSTINVSTDTEKTSKAVQDFVSQYNSTMGFIEEQMAVGAVTDEGTVGRGALAGDSSLRSLHDSLRRMVTDRHGNEGTSIRDISALGITTTDKSGLLNFDSSKLLDEFSKNPQNVINFFSYQSQDKNVGFIENLNNRIDSYISTSDGLIKSKTQSFDRSLKDLNNRIDRFNDRMERREEYYIRTFSALDVAMMEAESQMSWLSSQIQGMNAQMGNSNG